MFTKRIQHNYPEPRIADKAEFLRILEEQDKISGFIYNPNATAQMAREAMRACGIRPEDNTVSTEIIRMREME